MDVHESTQVTVAVSNSLPTTQLTQQTQQNANGDAPGDGTNDEANSMVLRSAFNADSSNNSDSGREAGALPNDFNKHIHLSGFSLEMTTDHIVQHILTNTSVTDESLFNVACLTDVDSLKQDTRFKHKFVSFKVSGSDEVIKTLSGKDVWPSFVEIRDFREHKFGMRRPNLGYNTRRVNRVSAPRTPRGSQTPSRRMNATNRTNLARNTPMNTPRSRPRNVRFNVQNGRNRNYRSSNNNNNNNQPNFLELLKMLLR